MINLENITKVNNIISAKIKIGQTHPEYFEISVDIYEQKVIRCTRTKMDMYVWQALAKIIKISEEYGDKLPEKEEAVWY